MPKIIFNGTEYAGGSGNYFNPVIYSDTERKIGVWRDNKPLYQKTVNFGSLPANNGTKTVAHGISNLETLANAVFVVQSSTQFRTLPNVSRGNTANQTVWYMTATDIGVLTGSSADVGSAYSGYVTLQYTKTTDVAGSGDYNTYGVPTVHYSTSEQVIGTWINGKPIYERTWDFSASPVMLSYANWVNSGISAGENIESIISAELKYGTVTNMAVEVAVGADGYPVAFQKVENTGNTRGVAYCTLRYTKTTD